MKLIIQIPCFNEAETLPVTLKDLPREVPGFDEVEWLVINDGSTDATAEVARRCGVDHVVSFTKNQGLARTFLAGLDAAIILGADVIVNTDADNQYVAADIPLLTAPIVAGKADIVVGERPIGQIESFSWMKKMLQRFGSAVVRTVSKTSIEDAPSGFRAMSREAARRINVFNEYTYTLETIIQAGQKNLAITSVPVRVNDELRPSRLVKSIPSYIRKSVVTIIRIFVVYKAFRFFMSVGVALFSIGLVVGLRFLWFYLSGDGSGHVQSLILASILLGVGFQTMLTAFLADLLAVNRRLMEDVQYRVKRLESRRLRPQHPGQGG
ncbi:glycosyltransferase family 2 protein [Geomesophilobacter sediminis]|uniref:Glycosyltransferase family 2 protein n=1 Tax=Geomesophilobacter sediminis TaxID=2798584 RepID=A0A8J7M2P8_9BACT|nr:glycosyltransferase family 2 protein [Geomesophilobacter sediminis]MBJ6727321.1 glycosyltransferase family 2 protein [Geomesophilobacter sediminis]